MLAVEGRMGYLGWRIEMTGRISGLLAGLFALLLYLAAPKATFAYEYWLVSGFAALFGLALSLNS